MNMFLIKLMVSDRYSPTLCGQQHLKGHTVQLNRNRNTPTLYREKALEQHTVQLGGLRDLHVERVVALHRQRHRHVREAEENHEAREEAGEEEHRFAEDGQRRERVD